MFKDAAMNVFERNKNNGENITEHALLMETISEITDQELQYDLMSNIEDGYADPEDPDTVEPRAGEFEDMEETEDEDHNNGRHLGVGVSTNRWANGVVRYKVVLESNFAGYWMWASRVLPAMLEVESATLLQFELTGWVWTSDDVQPDGTVYLRVQKSGCSANLGAPTSGRKHRINIGPWCSHGNILHELLHTAGMDNQQVASYRNRYVTVNFQNISPGMESKFYKTDKHGYEFLYDYGSIMHDGEYGFSRNGEKTIDCHGHACGQRAGLSYWDMWEIFLYYYSDRYFFVNGRLSTLPSPKVTTSFEVTAQVGGNLGNGAARLGEYKFDKMYNGAAAYTNGNYIVFYDGDNDGWQWVQGYNQWAGDGPVLTAVPDAQAFIKSKQFQLELGTV